MNTVFCGPESDTKFYNWDLGATCGGGSYARIDENTQIEEPPTPYDNTLITWNSKLHTTSANLNRQYMTGSDRINTGSVSENARFFNVVSAYEVSIDSMNFNAGKSVGLNRIASKGYTKGKSASSASKPAKIDTKIKAVAPSEAAVPAPDPLAQKEIQKLTQERDEILEEISKTANARRKWLMANNKNTGTPTLQTAVETILIRQLAAKKFTTKS